MFDTCPICNCHPGCAIYTRFAYVMVEYQPQASGDPLMYATVMSLKLLNFTSSSGYVQYTNRVVEDATLTYVSGEIGDLYVRGHNRDGLNATESFPQLDEPARDQMYLNGRALVVVGLKGNSTLSYSCACSTTSCDSYLSAGDGFSFYRLQCYS
jgi:hypothetical protein